MSRSAVTFALQLVQAENLNQIEPDFAFYSASYEDWDREAREEHIDEDVGRLRDRWNEQQLSTSGGLADRKTRGTKVRVANSQILIRAL